MNTLSTIIKQSDIELINEVPTIADLKLAKYLGYSDKHKIRTLIQSNAEQLARFGAVSAEERKPTKAGGRPSTVYHLNEEQALYITAKSNTPTAADITVAMVKVFNAWRQGHLAPIEQAASQVLTLDKDTRQVLGGIIKGIVNKALDERDMLATQRFQVLLETMSSLRFHVMRKDTPQTEVAALPAPVAGKNEGLNPLPKYQEALANLAKIPAGHPDSENYLAYNLAKAALDDLCVLAGNRGVVLNQIKQIAA